MYLGKKFIGIIPARGGSKGIPNKNIVDVYGKPLIGYTIEAAKQSKYLDHIYVSTDSESIAQVCRNYGININELRPSELATDEAQTIDVLRHVLGNIPLGSFDYAVLLQPTQPLRMAKHIDEAIEMVTPDSIESIVSVNEVSEHPIFMRIIASDGKLNSILKVSSTVRRQDLDTFYKVNGAIYINRVDQILNSAVSLNDNIYPYIMDKSFDLDIDTADDLDKLLKIKSRE